MGSQRSELVVEVRNTRPHVGYFCDIEGASKVTRAVLVYGEAGLEYLRCLVEELAQDFRAY